MDAVIRSLQETVEASLLLTGALQGDPASLINPQIIAASEDVSRIAGNALSTLKSINAVKADSLAPAQATMSAPLLHLAAFLPSCRLIQEFL